MGRICFNNQDVSGWPVSRRNVGIVFQSYALFPNLSAARNISYGLKNRGLTSKQVRDRVSELLNLVGLTDMADAYPGQLSGGQQQRVALARALALSPGLLLLDEPLSALDTQVRDMLRSEIRQLQQRLKITTLMVTHDQAEALTMADRILIVDRGRVVQDGTPFDIYDRPATPFVARFIGSMNFLNHALRVENGVYQYGPYCLRVDHGDPDARFPIENRAMIGIRPEDILVRENGTQVPNTIMTRVLNMEYRGPLFRITLGMAAIRDDSCRIEADVPSEKIRRFNIRPHMSLPVQFPMDRLRVYACSKTVDF
jgi:iron(III) transport system ATP-binding protein